MARPYSILLFSPEILDWRLVEFQLVIVILVVAIGMQIGGYGRDRLVLVDVDEVLQDLRLARCVCTHHLRTTLDYSSMVAK